MLGRAPGTQKYPVHVSHNLKPKLKIDNDEEEDRFENCKGFVD